MSPWHHLLHLRPQIIISRRAGQGWVPQSLGRPDDGEQRIHVNLIRGQQEGQAGTLFHLVSLESPLGSFLKCT